MPTYDYKCLDCGHSFEHFQRITEEPLKVCPICNGNLKRLIGAGLGPIFKGTGFYQTDYKTNSKTSAAKTEKKSSDSKNSSSSGKSDK